jgi:hypothetical protein
MIRVLRLRRAAAGSDRDLHAILRQLGAEPAAGQPEAKGPRLWVVASVNQPVFLQHEETAPALFQIQFAVGNDGDAAVDPGVEASQLLVNGKEFKDGRLVIGNRLRSDEWKALPPGKYTKFGYALGRYFSELGVSTVVWKGKTFQSPEIVFRVTPKKVN